MQDSDGHTALHIAAFRGHTELALALVSSGASPNVPSNEGLCALSRVPPTTIHGGKAVPARVQQQMLARIAQPRRTTRRPPPLACAPSRSYRTRRARRGRVWCTWQRRIPRTIRDCERRNDGACRSARRAPGRPRPSTASPRHPRRRGCPMRPSVAPPSVRAARSDDDERAK